MNSKQTVVAIDPKKTSLGRIVRRRDDLQARRVKLLLELKEAPVGLHGDIRRKIREVGRESHGLSNLIRRANRANSYSGPVSARWFTPAAECNVAGTRSRAKVHAPKDPKSKKQDGPRASQQRRSH